MVIKVEHYARAGAAQYIIVDDTGRGETQQLRLPDYRLEEGAYRLQALDAERRVLLAISDIWPGIWRDHVVCYDATGREIGDYVTVVGQAAKAKEAAARARREAAVRTEAEERATGSSGACRGKERAAGSGGANGGREASAARSTGARSRIPRSR